MYLETIFLVEQVQASIGILGGGDVGQLTSIIQ